MAILGNIVQAGVGAATDTYKDRLMDQLVKQREQDMERKKLQTALYEELVRSGAYGNVDPDDVLKYMQDTWGDHKGNRDFLKEHGENVGTLHKGINAAMGLLGIHPQGPSFVSAPRGAQLGPGQVTPTMAGAGAAAGGPRIAPPPQGAPPAPSVSSSLPSGPLPGGLTGSLNTQYQQAPLSPSWLTPPPTPSFGYRSSGMSPDLRVGATINIRGKGPHQITDIDPNDGTFDAKPVGQQ